MRSPRLLQVLLLLASVITLTLAWSKEDHEIFRLRDEVELVEGEGTTFYDFLGPPASKMGLSATIDDISRAYKKTSVKIHPDKQKAPKGVNAKAFHKKASERFARLGIVATILRGAERDRYDHFLKNGFPKWRGTGYYYARFRPGLGSVLVGIWIFAGVAHYLVLFLNARQQRQFMDRYIKEARAAAWGSSGVPGLAEASGDETGAAPVQAFNRKERRANKKNKAEGSGPSTPIPQLQGRRKVFAENGKQFIVDGAGNVFLVAGDQELLLDVNEIQGAMWRSTCYVTLPKFFWRVTVGRFFAKKEADTWVENEEDHSADDVVPESEQQEEGETVPKKKPSALKAESRKRKPKGGKK